jgi:hypothetical protein
VSAHVFDYPYKLVKRYSRLTDDNFADAFAIALQVAEPVNTVHGARASYGELISRDASFDQPPKQRVQPEVIRAHDRLIAGKENKIMFRN